MQRQSRVIVPLEANEEQALYEMCVAECRHPKEMARYLIRQEAIRRGLIAQGCGTPIAIAIIEKPKNGREKAA